MKNKGINFFQGHICVKTEDDRLCFVDDVCIPKIKERIDKFIKNNPKQFSVKIIIFTVLEDYFKISHSFRTPNHTSVTPIDDPLYTELLSYISNNPIYSKNLERNKQFQKDRRAASSKNIWLSAATQRYEKQKSEKLKKIAKAK